MKYKLTGVLSACGILLIGCSQSSSDEPKGQSLRGSCVYKSGANNFCVDNKTQDECRNNYNGSWSSSSCSSRGYGIKENLDEIISGNLKLSDGNEILVCIGMSKSNFFKEISILSNKSILLSNDEILLDRFVFIFNNNELSAINRQSLFSNLYHHDFGVVTENSINYFSYTIINNNSYPIKILNVHPSCNCTGVKNTYKTTLNPGEKTTINIEFNSSGFVGKVQKYIKIQTDDSSGGLTVLSFDANIN